MQLRNLIRFLLVHLIGAALFLGSTAFALDLASQSNESGGVTIVVKPTDVAAGAAAWSFDVSIRNNGPDLSDDLARTAYIMNLTTKSNQPRVFVCDLGCPCNDPKVHKS